jgi:hypothetical protein
MTSNILIPKTLVLENLSNANVSILHAVTAQYITDCRAGLIN